MTLSDDELRALEESADQKESLVVIMMTHVFDVLSEALDADWTDNEEVTVDRLNQDNNFIYAECSITFDESQHSGCEDMPHTDSRYERFNAVVELETGEVTFTNYEHLYLD